MTKPETNLTNKIIRELRKLPNSKVVKIHGGPYQEAGLPDIHATLNGRSVWLEVKIAPNRATPLQEKQLRELRTAGAIAEVVYSVEQAMELVRIVSLEVDEPEVSELCRKESIT